MYFALIFTNDLKKEYNFIFVCGGCSAFPVSLDEKTVLPTE